MPFPYTFTQNNIRNISMRTLNTLYNQYVNFMKVINMIKITTSPLFKQSSKWMSGILRYGIKLMATGITLPLFWQVSSSHFLDTLIVWISLSTAFWQYLHKPFKLNQVYPDSPHPSSHCRAVSEHAESRLLTNGIKLKDAFPEHT